MINFQTYLKDFMLESTKGSIEFHIAEFLDSQIEDKAEAYLQFMAVGQLLQGFDFLALTPEEAMGISEYKRGLGGTFKSSALRHLYLLPTKENQELLKDVEVPVFVKINAPVMLNYFDTLGLSAYIDKNFPLDDGATFEKYVLNKVESVGGVSVDSIRRTLEEVQNTGNKAYIGFWAGVPGESYDMGRGALLTCVPVGPLVYLFRTARHLGVNVKGVKDKNLWVSLDNAISQPNPKISQSIALADKFLTEILANGGASYDEADGLVLEFSTNG